VYALNRSKHSYSNHRVVVFLFPANADIYFDQSLSSLGDIDAFPASSVLAVGKWNDWWQSADHQSSLLSVRSDSQDAWIFRSPLNACASRNTDFLMGEVECDNRLAGALRGCGYSVTNPALFLRAVEYSSKQRMTSIYSRDYGGGRDIRSGSGSSGSGSGKEGGHGVHVLLADSPPTWTY
jgi:hypothetical protein